MKATVIVRSKLSAATLALLHEWESAIDGVLDPALLDACQDFATAVALNLHTLQIRADVRSAGAALEIGFPPFTELAFREVIGALTDAWSPLYARVRRVEEMAALMTGESEA